MTPTATSTEQAVQCIREHGPMNAQAVAKLIGYRHGAGNLNNSLRAYSGHHSELICQDGMWRWRVPEKTVRVREFRPLQSSALGRPIIAVR